MVCELTDLLIVTDVVCASWPIAFPRSVMRVDPVRTEFERSNKEHDGIANEKKLDVLPIL